MLFVRQSARGNVIKPAERVLPSLLPALLKAQIRAAQSSLALTQAGVGRHGWMFGQERLKILVQQSLELGSVAIHRPRKPCASGVGKAPGSNCLVSPPLQVLPRQFRW